MPFKPLSFFLPGLTGLELFFAGIDPAEEAAVDIDDAAVTLPFFCAAVGALGGGLDVGEDESSRLIEGDMAQLSVVGMIQGDWRESSLNCISYTDLWRIKTLICG